VLSQDFVVRWTYQASGNEPVLFDVIVKDNDTRQIHTHRTTLPYQRIYQHGNLEISVRAVLSDGVELLSESIMIELYGDSVERIKKKRELVVAVHVDNGEGLFCFQPSGSIRFFGFDIDLVAQIAQALKRQYALPTLTVRHTFVLWPEVITRPNQFDVDLAIASISITSDRKKNVLFSSPYWTTQLAVVYRAKNHSKADLFACEQFDGLNVAVHRDTTAHIFVEKVRARFPGTTATLANDNPELFSILEDNKVDAVMYDFDRTYFEQKYHPQWHFCRLDYDALDRVDLHIDREEYGMTFARNNTRLRDDIDAVLKNGEVDVRSIMNKWRNALRERPTGRKS
jgi:polar amino acid transport system substrate-binding protein